jgi:hypothetical protein
LLSSSILRSGGSAQVDDDKDDVDNDDAILSQRDLRRENDDDMPPPRPKRWKAIPEKTKALIFIHFTEGEETGGGAVRVTVPISINLSSGYLRVRTVCPSHAPKHKTPYAFIYFHFR